MHCTYYQLLAQDCKFSYHLLKVVQVESIFMIIWPVSFCQFWDHFFLPVGILTMLMVVAGIWDGYTYVEPFLERQ